MYVSEEEQEWGRGYHYRKRGRGGLLAPLIEWIPCSLLRVRFWPRVGWMLLLNG